MGGIMIGTPSKLLRYGLALALSASSIQSAGACTRVLYVGDDGLVIAGRSMDWNDDTRTNLWVFPHGMQRDGAPVQFGEMDLEIRQPGHLDL
jgi:penicillin V acylase-like amidase (Ntn superfamily)